MPQSLIEEAIQKERKRTILMIRNAAHHAQRWAVKESLQLLADLLESGDADGKGQDTP